MSPVNNKSPLCLESHPRGQPHVKAIPHRKQKEIKDSTAPCWLDCKRKLPHSIFEKQNMKHPSPFLPACTQVEGHLHLTFRKHVSDGIHHPKLLCNPGFLQETLKPTLMLEPEHFILGAKCQKATSLEAFMYLHFYHGAIIQFHPDTYFCIWRKRQRLLFLILFLQPSSSPGCSILPVGPAQLLQTLPSSDMPGGMFRQTLTPIKWRHLNTQRAYPSSNFWPSLKCCCQLPAVTFGLFYLPVSIPTIEN